VEIELVEKNIVRGIGIDKHFLAFFSHDLATLFVALFPAPLRQAL
jgi:hypothetical protein